MLVRGSSVVATQRTAVQQPFRLRSCSAIRSAAKQQTGTIEQPAATAATAARDAAVVFPQNAKADVTPRYLRTHQLLQEAQAPAGWLELAPGFPVLFIRDPDMMAEVLTDATRFPSSTAATPEVLGRSMSSVEDPQLHRQHRDALAPHFRATYVRSLVPPLTRTGQAVAATLVALSRDSSQGCDVEDLFRRAVLDNFGRTDLGYEFHSVEDMALPHDQRHLYDGLEFLELWDRAMDLSVEVVGSTPEQRQQHPQYPAYAHLLDTARTLLRGRIEVARERLASTGTTHPAQHTDLVALLLQQQASGAYPHLTDGVIEDELMLLMMAGFNGTAATLSWTLHHLVSDPPAMAAALVEISTVAAGRPLPSLTFEDYRRMEYLTACLTETLRFHSTGHTSRSAAVDTTVGGGVVAIPRGSAIIISQYSMGRHEAVFERAEEWLPQRWLPDGPQELKPKHKDAMLSFGIGPRICIGRQHVLLSIPVMLTQLLGAVRLAPAPGAPPIRLGLSLVARSVEGIWMTAEPRGGQGGPHGE